MPMERFTIVSEKFSFALSLTDCIPGIILTAVNLPILKGVIFVATLTIADAKLLGPIRPMHAGNNGPIPVRSEQQRGNADTYRAAGIPYARTHDASLCAAYGGEHTIDISAVFPDFSRDPDDPDAYDFVVTDHYLEQILAAGTQVFYRLGSKIEHGVKKYGTLPPADNDKWARVCEHIIRHCNEGWANGHHYGITYWEIWNEPDLDTDDSPNKRCWGGTAAAFYELFITAARHLKTCFPDLKIGGPALANKTGAWLDGFLAALTRDETPVPLDFFSWHIYAMQPEALVSRARTVREKLDRAGYTHTESICNEWNYIEGWTGRFIASIEAIIGLRGAAFSAACMLACQNAGLDMLMYYDARPSAFNGLWDFYTYRPLKGYYPFKMFSVLYHLGRQAFTHNDDDEIYAVSAAGKDGVATLIAYFPQESRADEKTVSIAAQGLGERTLACYLLDETHDMDAVPFRADRLTLIPNSVVLLRS